MNTWSLPKLLAGLHDDIERRLAAARQLLGHPGTKGDATESVWLEIFETYLPQRYSSRKGHVVDSKGMFSEQIDVIVFDRQYSPLIFHFEGQDIIPAESVYGVFEAKQTINATQIDYAQKKVASVRRLHRTSLPIPHAGGTYAPKLLPHILGGVLTFESDWSPALDETLLRTLSKNPEDRLDLGCVAAHGIFASDEKNCFSITPQGKPATAFLLELIARLQTSGTVPMIDTRAYAQWLTK
jgi:hypothetical protein